MDEEDYIEERINSLEDFNYDLDEDDFVDEEEEVSSEDFAEEETSEESLQIDFDLLNQNINDMYKLAPLTNRDQLKRLKADVWELEMGVEESGLSSEDIQNLAYTILEMDESDAVVLKWQISTAKQLLSLIVKR